MKTRHVVIDTSALLASHERAVQDKLERLHAQSVMIAPTLLAYEVANVVHAKRPEAFGASTADRAALVATLLLGIDLVEPTDESIRAAGALAEELKLSAYDAAFLALAASRGASLLTEDQALARAAAKKLGKTRVIRVSR